MSWILGYWGERAGPGVRERMAALHPSLLYETASARYSVAAGGLPQTCLHGSFTAEHAPGDWFVLGAGLRREDGGSSLLTAADWQPRVEEDPPNLSGLDGHFLLVRLTERGVECRTDALGLRTVFLLERDGGVYFSSRADWLARLAGGLAPDLTAIGAHWLGFNQLAPRSLVAGLARIGPGGRAGYDGARLEMTTAPWRPRAEPSSPAEVERTLTAICRAQVEGGLTPSLGLSGGLDSRLLLALSRQTPGLCTHIFGAAEHPDVAISRRITRGEGIPQTHLHAPVPDADTCLTLARGFAPQTFGAYPLSAVLGLRYYPALRERGRFVIDGGFGEIGRRQYLNRLRIRGGAALRSGDPDALLPFLRYGRADVLAPDAERVMQAGFRDEIAETWSALPPLAEIGAEDLLDLLSVRTRLPNYYGPEQVRLDGVNVCLMPMAQPSFLDAMLRLPLKLRRGGRLYRRLVRQHWPALARYPLVKGVQAYPFPLTALPAHLWTRISAQFSPPSADPTRHAFLDRMRSFVLDAVQSADVRGSGLYDGEKLSALAEGYYAGRRELAVALDWWLSLELWRQSLR